jgi:hypothetical protein
LVVISAAGAELEAGLLVDGPYALPEEDGVLAGADAAFELLLLLPQPAITSARTISMAEATPVLCCMAPPIAFRVTYLLTRPDHDSFPPPASWAAPGAWLYAITAVS